MKKFLVFVLISMATLTSYAKSLSSIERSGPWYYLYNEKGKRYKTMSVTNVGEVVGWSATFFVSRSGSWYYLYNAEGKKYKTMSGSSVGEVISVSWNTFTSRSGSWIYTYDSTGKRISTRSAR